MARKTFYSCDRCGKEWEEKIENGFSNRPRHLDYEALKRVDLCPECEDEFYKAIRNYCESGKNKI